MLINILFFLNSENGSEQECVIHGGLSSGMPSDACGGAKGRGSMSGFDSGPTDLMLPARWREIKDIGRDGELQREEKLMGCCGDAVPGCPRHHTGLL